MKQKSTATRLPFEVVSGSSQTISYQKRGQHICSLHRFVRENAMFQYCTDSFNMYKISHI